MALFLPLLALGLGAAGNVLSYQGQRKSAKAQADVLAQYRNRNLERQAEADAVFQSSLAKSGVDTAQQDIEAGAQKRQAGYDALSASSPGAPMPVTATGNRTVADVAKDRTSVVNAGNAWNKLMGRAQAKLGGYGDWRLKQDIKDTRTNQTLSRISTDARSDWQNVVPSQMQYASTKGDPTRMWGSLMSAAGNVIGMGSATGLFGGGRVGGAIGSQSPQQAPTWAGALNPWD